MVATQAAAEAVAREHPEGIDFLIVNAAIVDAQHKSGIETCALLRLASGAFHDWHAIV